MRRRPGPTIQLTEDDALFMLVYVPESVFVLIGGRNMVTFVGGIILILVCALNAFLVARHWRRHGRYS